MRRVVVDHETDVQFGRHRLVDELQELAELRGSVASEALPVSFPVAMSSAAKMALDRRLFRDMYE